MKNTVMRRCSDVNKDCTHENKDKDQVFKDNDKDQTYKNSDKDVDLQWPTRTYKD